MKHYLIKSINTIVSDAQPVKGYYYDSFIKAIRNTNKAEYEASEHCHQIEYSNNLEGLKPFELVDEVEELAYKELDSEATIGITTKGESQMFIQGFFKGYKAKAGYTKSQMIGFAEWISRNLWHQYGSGKDNLPAFKVEDWSGYWYNTINIKEMRKPLTSKELLTIYLKEQDSKLIEVIQIEDNKFKLKL